MEEKVVTITDTFNQLKVTADRFGAGRAEIKTEDNEWEYTVSVKRKKHK